MTKLSGPPQGQGQFDFQGPRVARTRSNYKPVSRLRISGQGASDAPRFSRQGIAAQFWILRKALPCRRTRQNHRYDSIFSAPCCGFRPRLHLGKTSCSSSVQRKSPKSVKREIGGRLANCWRRVWMGPKPQVQPTACRVRLHGPAIGSTSARSDGPDQSSELLFRRLWCLDSKS
jgi:hypothetical protein